MSAETGRECPPGTHSMFDPCWGDCTKPVGAREELESAGVAADVIDYALRQHAHELADADQGPLQRVRAVLESEAVLGRSALEYRGLITAALIDPKVSSNGE